MPKLWIALGIAVVVLVGASWVVLQSLPSRERGRGYDRTAARVSERSGASGDASSGAGAASTSGAGAAAGQDDAVAAALLAPGGAVLHGKVTDEADRGIEGAEIHVQLSLSGMRSGQGARSIFRDRLIGRADAAPARSARRHLTGPDGSYSIAIASIRPGTYEVLASHPDHAPRSEAWTWVAESAEMNFQLPPGDAITGTVLDSDGASVAGAAVEAYVEDEGGGWRGDRGRAMMRPFSGRTVTGDDGKFRLGVPAGTFRLLASAKGFAAGEVPGVPSGMQEVEVFLEPALGISGQVADSSGAPIEGARVRLLRGMDRDRGGWGGPGGGGGDGPPARVIRLIQEPEAIGTTDSEGGFAFTDLAPGAYMVSAEKPGFVPGQAGTALKAEEAAELLTLTLEDGHILKGTVKDTGGTAIAGAFVTVAEDRDRGEGGRGRGRETGPGGGFAGPGGQRGGPDGSGGGSQDGRRDGEGDGREAPARDPRPEPHSPFEAVAGAETDTSGLFTFDTLPAGRYSLSVQSDEFTVYRKDGLEVDPPVELEVVLDPGIQLEGNVLSSDGKPIEKAILFVQVMDGDSRRIEADAEGKYRLKGLYPGRLEQISLDAKGYTLSIIEGLEVAPTPPVQALDFRLDAAAVLTGSVTDARGAPVFNARLTVMPEVEEEGNGREGWSSRRRQMAQIVSARSGPDGKYTISEVNANPAVRVAIEHPDYKSFRSEPFSIRPGERREDLRFQLVQGGRLEVLVVDAGGSVFPGARVRVSPRVEESPEGERGGESDARRMMMRRGGRGSTRTSGPDGKAVFPGLDTGPHTVSAAIKGYQPYYAEVSIANDQVLPFRMDLEAESVLAGKVLDTTGAPLAGAALEAYRGLGEGRFERSDGRSAEDGAYRLGSLGEGSYSFRARLEGFAERRIDKVDAPGQLDVVLERLGRISGWVVAGESGGPVTSFSIRLRNEGERAGRGSEDGRGGGRDGGRRRGRDRERRSFNDPGGLFAIENVNPGSYILEVTAEGFSGVEVPARVEEGRATEGLEVRLGEGISLAGLVVLKGTVEPISGAQVFYIPLVTEGEESGDDPRNAGERRTERREEAEKRRAARRDGESRGKASVEAQMAIAAYRAASQGGRPVERTDEAGAFRLLDIPPGDYVVVVNHDSYVPAKANFTLGDDGVARFLQVELEKGEELDGELTLSNGAAAAGAMVFLRGAESVTKRVTADAAGRYHVEGLVPGTYTFSARAGGSRRAAPVQVKIEKGSNRFDYRIEEAAGR